MFISLNSEFLKIQAMALEVMEDKNIDSQDISSPYYSRKLPSKFEESTVNCLIDEIYNPSSKKSWDAL